MDCEKTVSNNRSLAEYSYGNNVTTLNADIKSCGLHLYMMNRRTDQETMPITKELSMHLSQEEVEELIKGLKSKLKKSYEEKVNLI